MNKHPLFVSNELKMATGWGRASKVAGVSMRRRWLRSPQGNPHLSVSLRDLLLISNKGKLLTRRRVDSDRGSDEGAGGAEAEARTAGAGGGRSASGWAARGGSCWSKMQIKYALSIISGQELWEVSY